jgi:NAD(P)-dependent dehydrogenase (short-subunit alcohol dehydrogenase family)
MDTSQDRGRTALVTGGGSGIGKAVAIALAAHGFRVAIVGRNKARLEEVAAMIGRGDVLVHDADLREPESVTRLFDAIAATFGRLDVLFNNAGVNAPATPFEDFAFDDWTRVVDTNLTAAFLCAQAAFRMMKNQTPQGGRIINNGSISATTPRPHAVAYTSSKHGVLGLTKTISLEGRKYNIACGQIDIGNTATSLTERMTGGTLQADFTMRPEPRFDVRHVADAVAFMANLPLDSNVQQLTIMATTMPFVGRG